MTAARFDPSTVTVIRAPANGSTAVDAEGRVTYTPNAGFTGRDTFDYRVADRDGQVVTATVTVDVGPPGPTPPNPGTPDLVVTKTADKHVVAVGELVTYRVVIENRGDGPAEDVVLVDTPVFDVDVVSVDVSQGTCEAGPPPTCALGTIPAGGKVTITVGVRPQEPGRVRNGVAVTGPSAETGNDNNGDVAGVVVRDRGASVRITKRADRRRMRPGGKVIYTIRVTSRGPETARNLRICDFLPRGMQAVRAPGGTIRGQRVCWRRAKAKVGRHLRYQVQARATLAGAPVRVNPVAVAGANFAPRVAAARVRVIGGQRVCAPRRPARSRARPADQESNPSPSRSSTRSHGPRRPSRSSARASARCVSRMPAQRAGSGGNGSGRRRTISSRVRSLSAPSSRSSATRAPKRLEPTPRPVNPTT